jgi:lipoprotein-releasing system ATP-binding protein
VGEVNDIVLSCRDLRKTYISGPLNVPVLLGIDLEVKRGEAVAIIGASGSGKSTLLHLLGGLGPPTSGTVELEGRRLSELSEKERGNLRNASLGFIYQFHHLLQEFTAVDNVAMPLFIRRMQRAAAVPPAQAILDKVGSPRVRSTCRRSCPAASASALRSRAPGHQAELRARRRADRQSRPDHRGAGLRHAARAEQVVRASLVIVTHDLELAARTDRVLRLHNGVAPA